MSEKKVLIIEDDIDLVEAMRLPLLSENYQVTAAYNTEDGYKKAIEFKPDVIILDVMFGSGGKTDGFDYAVKFKQDKELAKIPILMVTAVNAAHPGFGFSSRGNSEFLPIDDFIDKPAQPEDLLTRVNRLIERKVSKWANWPDAS